MNPVVVVGRYKFPLLNVSAINERQGLGVRLSRAMGELIEHVNARRGWALRWNVNTHDVYLTSGHIIRFNQSEKDAYDAELTLHEQVLQVWGMCKSAGLRS